MKGSGIKDEMVRADLLPPLDVPGLSPAERRAITLAKAGTAVIAIAAEMNIKVGTVRCYLSSARTKLRDANNRQLLGKLRFSPDIRHRSYL